MKKDKLPEVEKVVLPKFLGMRPGKYILIALVIVILILFFLIGILPGILNGGRYVSFNSELSNVGIILDEKYIGSTEGSRIFVPSGEHKVEFIKDSEVIYSETLKIDHPIVLTLIFTNYYNYLFRFTSSSINVSDTVIILELAWKPLCVVIISVNSVERSTLDISKTPDEIEPPVAETS